MTETVDKFAMHVQAVGQGVQSLRTTFGKVREVGVGKLDFTHAYFEELTIHRRNVEIPETSGVYSAFVDHFYSDERDVYHQYT